MRSLFLSLGLTASASADPLVDRVVGNSYEVTTTYMQGIPPDCGQTPHGYHPCPAAKTKTVTRTVTARAQDVILTGSMVGARQIRCATLGTVASPDPDFPHIQGEPKITPRGRAPKLPLCER
jgi:hypothetical protein